MKIIYPTVTDFAGNLVVLEIFLDKQLFSRPDTHLIQISIKADACCLPEKFTQIGAVITKNGRQDFQRQALVVSLLNIVKNLIHYIFTGKAADRVCPQFKLFR